MELKSKEYAIALEGGGAKGAYQIGVWQALREAGIKITAVAGTSVGALNGAMMCMDRFELAYDIWSNMKLTDVVAVEPEHEAELKKLVSGTAEFSDIHELMERAKEIIKNRGLDISPLRALVDRMVDAEQMKNSPVEFFITTVSLSDMKAMDVKLNGLGHDEICNMLIASAYHPSFRQEPLGGKHYADGGLVDNLPILPLVQNGYKDIIAVRIPGIGVERRFKLPKDVNVAYIDTDSYLGGVLNFEAEQSKRNLKIGYYDAMRLLYGLKGREYYIDKSMSEQQALDWLTENYRPEGMSLRQFYEKELPRLSRKLDSEKDDYYQLFLNCLEYSAKERGIEAMAIYTDKQLAELI